jgi:hypothetical protein
LTVVLLGLSLAACGGDGVPATAPDDGAVAGTAQTESRTPVQGTGVQGRITGPAGEPIEMASITVTSSPDGAEPMSQEANVTDADGRYFLPLSPGHWGVTISAFGHESTNVSVDVPNGEPVVLDVVLEPNDR